jgi:hypothetical protein
MVIGFVPPAPKPPGAHYEAHWPRAAIWPRIAALAVAGYHQASAKEYPQWPKPH